MLDAILAFSAVACFLSMGALVVAVRLQRRIERLEGKLKRLQGRRRLRNTTKPPALWRVK
jgi:hypothetical protein